MTPSSIVFLVDVDNTLLDNDRIQDDLKRTLSASSGLPAATATGRFSNSSSMSWATAIISAPCSATASSILKIFTSYRCRRSWLTTRSPIVSIPDRLT